MDRRTNISHDSELTLPREAADLPAAFATAFNTGQIDTVERLYEPDALLVSPGGVPATGERRRHANAEFLRLGLPITVRPRQVHVGGDFALLIVD